jgi:DNA-binding NtrC family response regulator
MAKILIIDDDKGMCYTLSEMVRLNGHEAVWAHTLKDGLETAIGSFFDVVFLDVMMPDGIGLDLIAPANGDIKKACRVSGMSRSRLYVLLKKHSLSMEGIPQDDKS